MKIGTTNVVGVYLGSSKVRPTTPPTPYTPGANTVFYFPFSEDATDKSGNGYILSYTGTQETVGRTFNNAVNLNKSMAQGRFASVRMKLNSRGSGYTSSNDSSEIDIGYIPGYFCYKIYGYYGGTGNFDYISTGPNRSSVTLSTAMGKSEIGNWVHIAWGYSSSTGAVLYVNGTKYTLSMQAPYTGYGTPDTRFIKNPSSTKANVTLSDAILETAIRTDQQVTDYFNATKSTYGVS